MSYAALQDLNERAGALEILQIADRDGSGVADADAVAAALLAADVRINAALAVRFILPLTTVPEVVKSWATSIARYILHRDGAPDHVKDDYKAALADLDRVTAGKLSVPGAEGLTPQTGGDGGRITYAASEPKFAPDQIDGFTS